MKITINIPKKIDTRVIDAFAKARKYDGKDNLAFIEDDLKQYITNVVKAHLIATEVQAAAKDKKEEIEKEINFDA